MRRAVLALCVCVLPVAADVRLPSYTRNVLPNGMVLDVMPRRDVPLVTIRLVVRGGGEANPPEMAGLSQIVGDMLRRGAGKRSADQFSLELDTLGATWQVMTNDQETAISIEFLAKDFDAALDLMGDAVLKPVFPDDELKKLLAQRVDAVKALKDNPQAAAGSYYRAFFFGQDHPYGRVPDEASYGRIARKEVAAQHGTLYAGKNVIMVVAGDIDVATATDKVRRVFGSMPEGHAYQWKPAELPRATSARIALVDKPDATQTYFYLGAPGIPRNHPDRTALWLVNTLIGGRFTSLLNSALRVDTGLSYGANSMYDQNHLAGRVTIFSYTLTKDTGKAIDLALETIRKVRENGLAADQLISAKAYLKGTYPSEHLETPDQLAEVLGDIELFDLNRSEVDDLFSRIDAVTLEQANAALRKYFTAENLTLLLLGQAGEIRSSVKKYAPEMMETLVSKPGFVIAK